MKKGRRTTADVLYDLFEGARKMVDRPNHAPTVASYVVSAMRDDITADDDVHEFLLINGMLPFCEKAFKRKQSALGARVLSPEQIEFQWPERVRPIIEAINRDHVFVPSVGEFVPLLPTEITATQLHEAADYLRGHAKDTMRVARLLDRLANIM